MLIHVIVFDDLGTVTGNAGTILEKHLGLSKASDAEFSAGSTSYWRKYIANGSPNIFAGGAPAGITTTGFDAGQFDLTTDNGWDQPAENIIFAAAGSNTYTLSGGVNYNGQTSLSQTGTLTASLGELRDGYDLFANTENVKIDFLLMGSAGYSKESAQELANKIISVAELRKDAIAFISPYRGAALTDTLVDTEVTVNSAETTTTNVLSFYASVASSSYAVFDSGYKYMYDRFADVFRYVPLNGDIAGLCARNDINNFPWYSPAGTARGAILNAVKLAYTPNKSQRDRLYSNRINPVIFSPGAGIILFGDKTGLARTSAFDRINVRRLFVYLEDAISRAAKDVLFEFNDEITRTNFVNTIEPFLRDIQAKRGIFDYVVVCDETNNTAAVIDANEFRADIYIKPARSINFIGLTFIATKTGVDFEEVIGNF
jgi:phage tail sheath protein FI